MRWLWIALVFAAPTVASASELHLRLLEGSALSLGGGLDALRVVVALQMPDAPVPPPPPVLEPYAPPMPPPPPPISSVATAGQIPSRGAAIALIAVGAGVWGIGLLVAAYGAVLAVMGLAIEVPPLAIVGGVYAGVGIVCIAVGLPLFAVGLAKRGQRNRALEGRATLDAPRPQERTFTSPLYAWAVHF